MMVSNEKWGVLSLPTNDESPIEEEIQQQIHSNQVEKTIAEIEGIYGYFQFNFISLWSIGESQFSLISNDSFGWASSISRISEKIFSNKFSEDKEFAMKPLSLEDPMDRFKVLMDCLSTDDSQNYGKTLAQAEQILLKLEEIPSICEKDEIKGMREQFLTAYHNLPEGPSAFTQLDIDLLTYHLEKSALVPHNVVCVNQKGEKFRKPEVSTEFLRTYFFSLGFSKIMHSREVKNFDGISEVCDVLMFGIKSKSFFSFFSGYSFTEQCEKKVKELEQSIITDKQAYHWGYQDVKVALIGELKDQEKANRLMDQGFQIYIALVYPEVSEKQLEIEF